MFCLDDWARPIFGVTSNFKSLSREEREQRDYQNMSKKRRLRYRVGICYYGKLLPRQLTSRVPPISGTQIFVPTEKSSYNRWSVNFTEGTPLWSGCKNNICLYYCSIIFYLDQSGWCLNRSWFLWTEVVSSEVHVVVKMMVNSYLLKTSSFQSLCSTISAVIPFEIISFSHILFREYHTFWVASLSKVD